MRVDFAFNLVLSAAGVALIGAIWIALQWTGTAALLGHAAAVAGQELVSVVRRAVFRH